MLNAPIDSDSKFREGNESCEAKGEAKERLMSVRSVVLAQLELVAKEQNREMPPLSDDLLLLDTGLDSLCFAIMVARLEDALGRDPFDGDSAVDFPVTLQDLINLYEGDAE
jgi:hypothetical protein